jgi:hypothetical protein
MMGTVVLSLVTGMFMALPKRVAINRTIIIKGEKPTLEKATPMTPMKIKPKAATSRNNKTAKIQALCGR